VIALLTGAAIGFTGSMYTYRALLHRSSDQVYRQMVRELRLTPAQQVQVRAVFKSTRARIAEARHDYEQRRHQMILDAYRQIRSDLDPAQQALLDRDFVSPELLAEVRDAGTVAPASDSSAPGTPAQ